jgi:hypothetical protein
MNLKENYIRYFGNIVEQDDVMDKEVENPETGNKIKVKTAMQLPDSHPAHKEAQKLIDGEKAKPSGDKEKEKVKGQDLFKKDTKKSDGKKEKAKSASKEKVQIAKDLDNTEQISKDPMGTAEKLGDLLSDVLGELEELPDSELADDSYVLVDDEFSFRLTRLEDDLEYGDDEEKEQAIKDLKDLTSDVEQFMDVNYSKLKGIKKPSKFGVGRTRTGGSFIGYRDADARRRQGGMYDNVNKSSNKKLQEIIEKTTNI